MLTAMTAVDNILAGSATRTMFGPSTPRWNIMKRKQRIKHGPQAPYKEHRQRRGHSLGPGFYRKALSDQRYCVSFAKAAGEDRLGCRSINISGNISGFFRVLNGVPARDSSMGVAVSDSAVLDRWFESILARFEYGFPKNW